MEENQGLQAPGRETAGTSKGNGMALASMIIGIISVPAGCVYLGVILGPLAIIFGIIGLKRCKKDQTVPGKGMAIAGIICGIVGTLIGLAMIIYVIAMIVYFTKRMPVSSYGP